MAVIKVSFEMKANDHFAVKFFFDDFLIDVVFERNSTYPAKLNSFVKKHNLCTPGKKKSNCELIFGTN